MLGLRHADDKAEHQNPLNEKPLSNKAHKPAEASCLPSIKSR
jgi:hypothetical protein